MENPEGDASGFTGKKVLDLGCGYGWHCEYAADHGAVQVVGVDISEKMLKEAENRHSRENITYLCCPVEDAQFEEGEFDIVLSSLALHYIRDYDQIVDKIRKFLRPGGYLFFLRSILFLPQREARTGIMMKMENLFIFRWIITIMREKEMLFSWGSL